MNKRFFIAWLVVFIVWFAGDFVVHGVLLHADYASLANLFRREEEAQNFFPLMILAHLLMSGAWSGSMRAASRRSRGSARASATASQSPS